MNAYLLNIQPKQMNKEWYIPACSTTAWHFMKGNRVTEAGHSVAIILVLGFSIDKSVQEIPRC